MASLSPKVQRPTVLLTPPLSWQVIWDSERSDDADVWGMIKHRNGQILLHDGAPPDRQRVTLLHEWLHAEGYQFETEDRLNERQICVLAAALLRMMKANPGVVAWLMEEVGSPVAAQAHSEGG